MVSSPGREVKVAVHGGGDLLAGIVLLVVFENPTLQVLDQPSHAGKAAIEARLGVGTAQAGDGVLQQLGRPVEISAPRHGAIEIGEEEGPAGQLGESVVSGTGGVEPEKRAGDLLGRRERRPGVRALPTGTPGTLRLTG